MKASERLGQLKEESDSSLGIDRFVSLTNPKNVILMESVVAWTCCKVFFDGDSEVSDDATMDDLWKLSSFDVTDFADTSGLNITDSFAKMKQMKHLGIVYPDGTANSRALAIIKLYVKGKMENLS